MSAPDSDPSPPPGPAASPPPGRTHGQPSQGLVECLVAIGLIVVGLLVSWDSWRLGARWSELRGPGAGYFPFYLGLLLAVCGAVVLVHALRWSDNLRERFIEVHQIAPVLTVLLPTIAYIGAMQWLGFYVASILFVASFMRFAGDLAWWKCLSVSSTPLVLLFWLFEKRFLVPLPKGPIEAWLGF